MNAAMHRRLKPSILLGLVALLITPGGNSKAVSAPETFVQAEQHGPISVTSDLVTIPVSVTDAKGRFVSDLARENFRIYEDNQPQEISLFEQEDTPVSVGLLVDHSGSMESKLAGVISAISGFTHVSNPQDEMFVVNFGDKAKIQSLDGEAFTSDSAQITRAVGTSAIGRTALYDAVLLGIDHLRLSSWQKKALLIISDGGDNASSHKYSEVLAQARQSQVSIYAIGLVDEFGEEENPKILEELCKDTGGIVFFPRSKAAILTATSDVARDLREQYVLGFIPQHGSEADSYHKIGVRVSKRQGGKLHVRARHGYSAAPGNLSSVYEGVQ